MRIEIRIASARQAVVDNTVKKYRNRMPKCLPNFNYLCTICSIRLDKRGLTALKFSTNTVYGAYSTMDKITLQAKLDDQKWNDSVMNHRDMCGAYDYCAFCDKNIVLPCATAFEKMNEQKATTAAEPSPVEVSAPAEEDVTELHSSLGKKFDYDKVMAKKAARKSLTFAEKYALADDIIKERYEILKDALTATAKGTPKIKSRISKQCDTYRREGDIVAKITIIGTSLRINLPLDPDAEEFNDGRTPHTSTGHKKVYEEVPFQFKVNSKLALKRALALIDLVK